ncbi:hypothetical protein HK103_006645 [Boothiomyces macroporosus]|uniref:ER membrane protein complex subunit 1 n=1 Tax=Boothiomyces macroporosus TaxID=261099 RepID=A0AAD5UDI3_9FUNG|nr:hypothetical protein HK103_006645 [Boothiomyces macroporosus]
MNLFLLITSIFCLYEKDAGVLDWHQKHIGTPVSINHFHQSTIISTDKNIIASLNQNEILERIQLASNIIKTITNVLVYTLTDSAFYIHDQDLFLINEIPVKANDFIVEGDSVYLYNSNTVYKIKEGAFEYTIPLDFKCLGLVFRDGLFVYGKNTELVVGKVAHGNIFVYIGKIEKTEFPGTSVHDLVSIHTKESDYLIWRDKEVKVTRLGDNIVTELSKILPGYENYTPVQIPQGSRFALEKGTKSVIVTIDDDFKAHIVQKHSSNLKKYTFSKYGKEEIISIIHQQGNQIIVESDQEHKFEIDSSKYGQIEKVWTEHKHTREGYSPRLFATTTDGSLHYFEKNVKWTLEESLAYSVDALMVDLPVDNHSKEIELPTNKSIIENYVARITRHLSMKSFETIGDVNGFKKVAVFVTKKHKIYGIDTTTGAILWQEFVDFTPQKIYLGRDYRVGSPPVVSIIGKKEKITITPNTKATRDEFSKVAGSIYFFNQEGNRLTGYIGGEELESTFSSVKTWSFSLSPPEKIVRIAKADFNTVASLGRVLGDRSVLYKYLNPNLVAILTLSETKSESATSLYLLDSVSGTLHHKVTSYGTGNLEDDMHLLFCENFVIYTYWNYGPSKVKNATLAVNSQHYEIAVLELYESSNSNNRVESSVFSSFHNTTFDYIAQTFISAHAISSIGVTRTLAGITSREIIFGLKQGMLLGASRKILDPRRPRHNPTSYDKEEQLYPYHPIVGNNPKDALSYNLQVLNPTTIISKETLLESTSLVLSYGTDLFLTRRMPSKMFDQLKDDFSYFQLILSILALVGGIIAARYYSEKKIIREAWS